jgi:hypothetical protein
MEDITRHYAILSQLSSLPRKMLSLRGQENITEFVLHELCGKHCFDLQKAAYFIDNPDFDCLKGVAGFCATEAYSPDGSIWNNPSAFSTHMQGSQFNQKVRTITHTSMRKDKKGDSEIVDRVARELNLQVPGYYSWDMKHDNHGLLIYERRCQEGDACDIDSVLNGLSLLGFCPIF